MPALEQLLASLSAYERREAEQVLQGRPRLLALWQQLLAGNAPTGQAMDTRQRQERHRLYNLVLDVLARQELDENYYIWCAQQLARCEVLLSRNRLLENWQLLDRLRLRAIEHEDRLRLPEILLRQIYVCRLLGKLDQVPALAQQAQHWLQCQQHDLALSQWQLLLTGAEPQQLQQGIAELQQAVQQPWPQAQSQETWRLLARLHALNHDFIASQQCFSQSLALLELGADSPAKTWRQAYLTFADWLLCTPDPTSARQHWQWLPVPVVNEPRARFLQQWVQALFGLAAGQGWQPPPGEWAMRLNELQLRQSLYRGIQAWVQVQDFKSIIRVLTSYQIWSDAAFQQLLQCLALLAAYNQEGAEVIWRRLRPKQNLVQQSAAHLPEGWWQQPKILTADQWAAFMKHPAMPPLAMQLM